MILQGCINAFFKPDTSLFSVLIFSGKSIRKDSRVKTSCIKSIVRLDKIWYSPPRFLPDSHASAPVGLGVSVEVAGVFLFHLQTLAEGD